jgi:preprotein translocase subunit SecY
MFESFRNIFKIPELRKRIFFTIALILVYRIGRHLPTPGIDLQVLHDIMSRAGTGGSDLLGLIDMFSGGNMKNFTIFALGIMPYISSSIIFQLLQAVVPALEKLAKEGEYGKKKITQYMRVGTVVLSVVQAFGISLFLAAQPGMVTMDIWSFRLLTILTMTTGTIFIMWLGEQITDRGIGNGISLIIMAGIIAGFPQGLVLTIESMLKGTIPVYLMVIVVAIMIAVIASVVIIQQAQRRLPVQYAKRVVGRRVMGGQATHIPLRVNTAGVIPVIFSTSLIMFPGTIIRFFGTNPFTEGLLRALAPGNWLYIILDVILIIFFTYFYTAVVLNPQDIADNMKKYGGFIPGIRPGKNTADYIERVLTRITLAGALFLAAIDVLPTVLYNAFHVPFYFGGTSILIVVGVALDTMRQIESHLLMRHYDGFVKKGRLRGRV